MAEKLLIAFSEHAVHAHLKEARRQLAELSDDVLRAAEEHDPEDALTRLALVLEYVGALLASVNPALVTPQILDDLDTQVSQVSTALGPLRESEDFTQIQTIQVGTKDLLDAAARIAPAVGVWADGKDARKAAVHLGEAASAKTRQLQKQANDLKGALDRLREEIGQASASVKTTSEERLDELRGQLDTLKAEIESEREQSKQSINGFQSQFDADRQQRAESFEGSKKEISEQAAHCINEAKEAAAQALASDQERANQAIAAVEERTNETMSFLSEKKREAIDMVDSAATSSTAGGFKTEANEQQAQADQWRRYAVLIGGAAAFVAVVSAVVSLFSASSPSLIVAKVAAVTLLLGIAGYAAGQSGQHRRREQRARRLYLELVAFKPFSEPLGAEQKLAVRKDFIERMFVGDPGEDHHERDPRLSDENLSALANLVELIRSVPARRGDG